MDFSVCPCCIPTVVIGVLAFSWVFLKITSNITVFFDKSSMVKIIANNYTASTSQDNVF